MQALDVRTGTDRTVPVSGGALTVQTTGAGRPLLFIHGWTLDHRAWQPQMPALGDAFYLVTYDRRGCGRSTAPPDLSLEIDDVERLFDALDIDKAAIIAMSQGCRVALGFALRQPDRVSSLILSGAPLPYQPTHGATEAMPIVEMTTLSAAGRWTELAQLLRKHPLMQLGDGADTALLDRMIGSYRGRDLMAPAGHLTLTRDMLCALQAPTLLLAGEHDSAARRAAAVELARLLPRSRAEIVEDAHHLCNLSHPARFNAALTTFLEMHHDH